MAKRHDTWNVLIVLILSVAEAVVNVFCENYNMWIIFYGQEQVFECEYFGFRDKLRTGMILCSSLH